MLVSSVQSASVNGIGIIGGLIVVLEVRCSSIPDQGTLLLHLEIC
jgi:hypothetical protein